MLRDLIENRGRKTPKSSEMAYLEATKISKSDTTVVTFFILKDTYESSIHNQQ